MECLFIYLLHLANIINFIVFLSLAVSLTSGIFYAVFKFGEYDEDKKIASDIKPFFIVFTIIAILSSLFPTKEILVLMGGTYLGKKVANQISHSKKLEKVNTIIDLQLDEYIKKLQAEGRN